MRIDMYLVFLPCSTHIQVRSFNQYLVSDWSQGLLVSRNQKCDGGSGLQPSGAEDLVYEAMILIY